MGQGRGVYYGYCRICRAEYDGAELGQLCDCGAVIVVPEIEGRQPTAAEAMEFFDVSDRASIPTESEEPRLARTDGLRGSDRRTPDEERGEVSD